MNQKIFTLIFMLFCILGRIYAQTGHLPFNHDHSSNCGKSTGVCYGYAMGRCADPNGTKFPNCNPATIIPSESCSNEGLWMNLGINGTYFTYVDDATLSFAGPGIVKFSGHTAYASSGAFGGSSLIITNIHAAGQTPTTDTLRLEGGVYKLRIPEGTYIAEGYYQVSTFWVTAENKFYIGAQSTTDSGEVMLANYYERSPITRQLNWNGSYQASTSSSVVCPYGYKQIFTNWTMGGVNVGNELTVDVVVTTGNPTYRAEFYQSASVTLTPVGGGRISYDQGTRSVSYSNDVQLHPTAEQVNGTAVNEAGTGVVFAFAFWTNNLNNDTARTAYLSFTPSAAITYTAHFKPKPDAPTSVTAGGSVNENIHVTWTNVENSSITYEIWRKTKFGSPGYATSGAGTGWEDPLFMVTGTSSDSMLTYSVYSVYDSVYKSDPANQIAWATYQPQSIDKDAVVANEDRVVPQSFKVGNYPNPFNPSTTISYQLAKAASVNLEVYDMMGRRVRTLVDGSKSAGYYDVVWNSKDESGSDVSSGVYLYRFTATPTNGDRPFMQSGKLMLTR
jgi:hypothetical protein